MALPSITSKVAGSDTYNERKILADDVNQIREAIQTGAKDIKPKTVQMVGNTITADNGSNWIRRTNNTFQYHNGSAWVEPTTANLLTFTAGENIAARDVVYLKVADGKIYKASTTNSDWIGVATAAITSGASGTIYPNGSLVGGFSGLTSGTWYGLNATAGTLTANNNYIVGLAISATQIILVKPKGDMSTRDNALYKLQGEKAINDVSATNSGVLAGNSQVLIDKFLDSNGQNNTVDTGNTTANALYNVYQTVYNYSTQSDLGGIFFNTDGTKMYLVFNGTNTVRQFNLGTAWDVSTASYASKYYDVTTQSSNPYGLFFNTDGTKMYVSDQSSCIMYQYSLSTAWDVSTASYASKSLAIDGNFAYGFWFDSTGTKLFVAGYRGHIRKFTLSTGWDISTGSLTTEDTTVVLATSAQSRGIWVSDDGYKLFVLNISDGKIYEFYMTTAYDLATINYNYKYLSTSGSSTIFISPSQFKLYAANEGSENVYQYMHIPFDLYSGIIYRCALSGSTYSDSTIQSVATTIPTGMTKVFVTPLMYEALSGSDNITADVSIDNGAHYTTGVPINTWTPITSANGTQLIVKMNLDTSTGATTPKVLGWRVLLE